MDGVFDFLFDLQNSCGLLTLFAVSTVRTFAVLLLVLETKTQPAPTRISVHKIIIQNRNSFQN